VHWATAWQMAQAANALIDSGDASQTNAALSITP